jgi:hypothetical protein
MVSKRYGLIRRPCRKQDEPYGQTGFDDGLFPALDKRSQFSLSRKKLTHPVAVPRRRMRKAEQAARTGKTTEPDEPLDGLTYGRAQRNNECIWRVCKVSGKHIFAEIPQ